MRGATETRTPPPCAWRTLLRMPPCHSSSAARPSPMDLSATRRPSRARRPAGEGEGQRHAAAGGRGRHPPQPDGLRGRAEAGDGRPRRGGAGRRVHRHQLPLGGEHLDAVVRRGQGGRRARRPRSAAAPRPAWWCPPPPTWSRRAARPRAGRRRRTARSAGRGRHRERPDRRAGGQVERADAPLHRHVEPAAVLDHPPVRARADRDRGARGERAAGARQRDHRARPRRPRRRSCRRTRRAPSGRTTGRRTARAPARRPGRRARGRPAPPATATSWPRGRQAHGAREGGGRDRAQVVGGQRSVTEERSATTTRSPGRGHRDGAGGVAERRRGAAAVHPQRPGRPGRR